MIAREGRRYTPRGLARERIVGLLRAARAPVPTTMIVARFGLSRPGASMQLAALERDGLVVRHGRGGRGGYAWTLAGGARPRREGGRDGLAAR